MALVFAANVELKGAAPRDHAGDSRLRTLTLTSDIVDFLWSALSVLRRRRAADRWGRGHGGGAPVCGDLAASASWARMFSLYSALIMTLKRCRACVWMRGNRSGSPETLKPVVDPNVLVERSSTTRRSGTSAVTWDAAASEIRDRDHRLPLLAQRQLQAMLAAQLAAPLATPSGSWTPSTGSC